MGECSYSSLTQTRDPTDDSGIRLCKTSPKFLESNATSHTWVFSAIAELVDNAYDPDVRATQLHIDEQSINNQTCLVLIDDGKGLNEEQLYRMLSFGYSDKPDNLDYKPIGRYGNGFKSGSMRLGKDALVLTKQDRTLSVGLLSQTYHERINADTVRIPIVTFDRETLAVAAPVDQNTKNLEAILTHSIFSSADELIDHLTSVPDFDRSQQSGTKIIVWNLRELGQGRLELCFRHDIRDIVYNDPDFYSGPAASECASDMLDYEHSLRKYCSILYLRPRMKIFILGGKVRSRLIARDLCKTEMDTYTMKGQAPLSITFGFNPTRGRAESVLDYGIIMYHKNRLIKAYEKVGYQKQTNTGQGYGVVGVVEADFLTPSHNKQNFNADEKYHRVMNALAKKLNEYWDTKMAMSPGQGVVVPKTETYLEPDCEWVQCDQCLKWRRLPEGTPPVLEEAAWYCSMHPTEAVASLGCRAPEDKLDFGEIDFSIQSTYRREKNEVAKKRKTSMMIRARASPATDQNDDRVNSKRRRTEDDEPSSERRREGDPRKVALLSNVRKKIIELNRKAQSLLVERPPAVGDIAEALHRDLEQNRDDDESRTVLCVRCHSWKKLPAGVRVNDTNSWECSMHPDESQRNCNCQTPGHDYARVRSPLTEEEATSHTDNRQRTEPSDNQRESKDAEREGRSADVEIQGPLLPTVVTLDLPSDGEESGEECGDIKALQQAVDSLSTVVDAVQRERENAAPVKPDTNFVGCQTDATEAQTSADGETQTGPCGDCETMRQELAETRRQVAELLNLLLEQDVKILPENALETVAMLVRNERAAAIKQEKV